LQSLLLIDPVGELRCPLTSCGCGADASIYLRECRGEAERSVALLVGGDLLLPQEGLALPKAVWVPYVAAEELDGELLLRAAV
jgi:hypothetical protein